ncbi:hypothetical protein C0J52_16663 [Blattella germanica]|nr:hypothetical protein C0J52_16663 [Blattella germanica]
MKIMVIFRIQCLLSCYTILSTRYGDLTFYRAYSYICKIYFTMLPTQFTNAFFI